MAVVIIPQHIWARLQGGFGVADKNLQPGKRQTRFPSGLG